MNESLQSEDSFDEERIAPAPIANVYASVQLNVTTSGSVFNTTAANNIAENVSTVDSSY